MKHSVSVKLSDFLSGKNVWDYYRLYSETQWYSEDEMYQFRLAKVKSLLHHCYENVPFYKNHFDNSSINPYKIKDLDVLKSLPVINKQIVLHNYKDFISSNIEDFKGVKSSSTSGTTGQVLKILTDSKTRSSIWGSFERFYDWMGRTSREPLINLKGGHVVKSSFREIIKGKLLALIENRYLLNAYDLKQNKIEYYYNWINSMDQSILRGYAQNLSDLALRFKKEGYSLNLKAVTTTAETLMPFQRKIFKEVFGCDTFDQYGCGEIGGIAYECEAHEGLHITEERGFVYTNNSEELIVTDLDNHVFPLINYNIGDQATLTDQKCSCGRHSQMLKEIHGRSSDNIYGPNGNSLHWGYFHHLLIDTGIAVERNLKKFQVIQHKIGKLEFLLESDNLNNKEISTLKNSIQKALGEIDVEIKTINHISNIQSGKYRAVISKINPL